MDDAELLWVGYERSSNGQHSARIRCEWCSASWIVPKCWLRRPSPACVETLKRHRLECPAPADARR